MRPYRLFEMLWDMEFIKYCITMLLYPAMFEMLLLYLNYSHTILDCEYFMKRALRA